MRRTFGLLGFPLGHSFSARYFAEKFKNNKIDAEYLNFELQTVDDIRDLVRDCPSLEGFNVTIPFKKNIIKQLDELSDKAQQIGAVNVVKVIRNSPGKIKLVGYNADIIGFTKSLQPLLLPSHTKALVLGATGGASLAVWHGLEELGIQPKGVSRSKLEGMITYDNITAAMLEEYTVVINCTPIGMFPHVNEYPKLPYESLNENHLLYDLIYNPEETEFLRFGREKGAITKNGLEMLYLQAEASWEIWNNNI